MKKYFYLIMLIIFIGSCSGDDPIEYTLTINTLPIEGGNVSAISGLYEEGSSISLFATPSTEYNFKNWSGGASGTSNPITVVMTSNKSVTAVFEKIKYSVTIEIEGEGTVTEELISNKSSGDFPSGSSVLLTAVPSEGWLFTQWSGDLTGTENPRTITINEPKNVKAIFQPATYVPDDIFEQYLIDEGYDDKLDNYVLTSNLQSVEELNIPWLDIYDLTGIEGCINLERLLCYGNDISSLDLSENTKLVFLSCGQNPLTSLDISNNLYLDTLYCQSTQLSSLDVSNNTLLTSLACWYNSFTCIQVNQSQLDNIPLGWEKDGTAEYSLDCN